MPRLRPTLLLTLACAAPATVPAAAPAQQAVLERLASCTESWMDWKQDPAAAERFRDFFLARFEQEPRSPGWRPRRPETVYGLPIVKAFPQSVGMGVGFSLEVRAAPDQVRRTMETAIGRPLKCEAAEGELACEAQLAERRTALVVISNEGKGQASILGCYYFYQQ